MNTLLKPLIIESEHPTLPMRTQLTINCTHPVSAYDRGTLSMQSMIWDHEQRQRGGGMDLPDCWMQSDRVRMTLRTADMERINSWLQNRAAAPSALRTRVEWRGAGGESNLMSMIQSPDGACQIIIYQQTRMPGERTTSQLMSVELTADQLAQLTAMTAA